MSDTLESIYIRRGRAVKSAGSRGDISVLFSHEGLEIFGNDCQKVEHLGGPEEKVMVLGESRIFCVKPHRSTAFIDVLTQYWNVALVTYGGQSIWYCLTVIRGEGKTPPPPPPPPAAPVDDLAALLGIMDEFADIL